jgi:hypothetical protein
VCVRCGASKERALGPCGSCKYTPEDETGITLSLILSQQFSTADELIARAADIRERRNWLPNPATLSRALAVARAMLQKKTLKTGGEGSQKVGPAVPSTALAAQTKADERPTLFASNSFCVLQASPRDSRAEINRLAEERAITEDSAALTKARAELTQPRARLAAEIGFLPAVSPRRATEYLALVAKDPRRVLELKSIPCLARSNLLAAAFERMRLGTAQAPWATWLCEFAGVADEIDPEVTRRDINEDRSVAGFPEITNLDWVEAEIAERRKLYKAVVVDALDRLASKTLVESLTQAVATSTKEGTAHAPRLIEDVIADYELKARPALSRAEEAIAKVLERIREATPRGESAVAPYLAPLGEFLKAWTHIARPAQLCAKSRGEEHVASQQLFYTIRGLAVDAANEHGQYGVSKQITQFLEAYFSHVHTVSEKVEEDAAAVQNLINRQAQAIKDKEEFEREITYAADIGWPFKKRLSVSSHGVSWGKSHFALQDITRVRWCAVRHSTNGVPTGTTYHIAFGSNTDTELLTLHNEQVWTKFTSKLFRATAPIIMTRLAKALSEGRRLTFGDIVVSDEGCEVPTHYMFRNQRIQAPWSDLHVWCSNGFFVVGMKSNDKAYGSTSYKDGDNAHLLEAMIRAFFKDPKAQRLSQSFI